jgi:hypothetical protein
MRKSRLAPAAVLLLGLGCHQATHRRVFVDFEAVLASYSASPLPSRPVPHPPSGLPAKTLSIPAVAPRSIVVEGASATQANALLEQNRKTAVRELTKLLAERYVREVERAGQTRIHALEPAKRKAYEEAQSAIRTEFDAYAQKRGGKLAELTSLVGFPDPNPLSLPPTVQVPKFVQTRLDRAAQLRKDIAGLDDDYQNRVASILAAAEKQYDVSLTEARLQIEEDRAAAFARAEQEATAEAAKSYKSLAPLIMGGSRVDLPGRPAQSVTLPAIPVPRPAPNVRERTLTLDQRRTILKDQLDMWIAVNGYELSTSSDGVPNVTPDFIKWRKERKL